MVRLTHPNIAAHHSAKIGARVLLLAMFAAGASQSQPIDFRATFEKYCVSCHNQKLLTGGLALSASAPPEILEKAVRRLRARTMPPIGVPRPDERTYDATISSLETVLDRLPLDPGRTETFRRLTRTEYRNAIRDLLGVSVDVSALLPSDDSSHGFDNVTSGELSPTLLERYLGAAQKISRLAVGSPVPAPGGETILLPPDLTQEAQAEELPFGTRGGALVPYNFSRDAEYEFQLRLTRDRNEHVEG